jgi:hypothetical protein
LRSRGDGTNVLKGTRLRVPFSPPRTVLDGVAEYDFRLGEVLGMLWTPAFPSPGMPLVLMGHGGSLYKRHPGLAGPARQAAIRDGFAVAAIGVPGHGDRMRSPSGRYRSGRRRSTHCRHCRRSVRALRSDIPA